MKLNIRDQLKRIDWARLRRASAVPGAIFLGAAFVLASVFGKEVAKKFVPRKPPVIEKVLYIGDSLSVGTFGELVSNYLVDNYHRENVAFYASCGSSPESWLSDEPVFETKCGYRELIPFQPLVYGERMRHRTPKIERLLRDQKPTIVIVQQGTNWMDRPLTDEKIGSILDRFIGTIHRNANCRIFWIAPPDSARFRRVQGRICTLIKQHQHAHDPVIDSRRLTRYVNGKTGGDGVHYRSEAATQWAQKVIPILDTILPKSDRKVADADVERTIRVLDSLPVPDAD
jgi:hypothetical protein